MAEYYVIREKNTGLYFRGKGVNRWGKHYNQASIYRVKGSAEFSCKEINHYGRDGEQAELVPIQILESTEDVVPKSEVDRLKVEGGILEQECGKLQATVASLEIELEAMRSAANSYKMHYEGLAREIFKEIERTCVDTFGNFYIGATHGAFAELKKKYTESCTDCTHFVGCECFDGKTCDDFAEQKIFSPEEVRKMTPSEVRKNYKAIMESMKKWK